MHSVIEIYSSRSQETHPYFVEDNLEQNNFIVGIEFLQLKFKGKHPYTRFKTFSITPARVNSSKRASFAGAEILSPCLIYALISE